MRHRATSLGEIPEQRPLKAVDRWLIWGCTTPQIVRGIKPSLSRLYKLACCTTPQIVRGIKHCEI